MSEFMIYNIMFTLGVQFQRVCLKKSLLLNGSVTLKHAVLYFIVRLLIHLSKYT